MKHLLPQGKRYPLAEDALHPYKNYRIDTWISSEGPGILISSSSISQTVRRLCFMRFFSTLFFPGPISSHDIVVMLLCCASSRRRTQMPVLTTTDRAMPRSALRHRPIESDVDQGMTGITPLVQRASRLTSPQTEEDEQVAPGSAST